VNPLMCIMKTLLTLLFMSITSLVVAQNCEDLYIYEEENGLLVIEYEHAELIENWKLGTTLLNYTGEGYIYWDGNQYFNQTGNGNLEYTFKVNNPGKYRFVHRMATGAGTNTSDHNDIWLKINADIFYGEQNGGHKVLPKPECNSNAFADCPDGSSLNGFFKVYGHSMNWKWNANTSDGNAHPIYVQFNEEGIYTITINARSSWCLLYRMVLQKVDEVNNSTAQNLNNNQSICVNEPLVNGLNTIEDLQAISLYPNPVHNNLNIEMQGEMADKITIINAQGQQLKINYVQPTTLDVSELETGLYFLVIHKNNEVFSKRFLKY